MGGFDKVVRYISEAPRPIVVHFLQAIPAPHTVASIRRTPGTLPGAGAAAAVEEENPFAILNDTNAYGDIDTGLF